MSYPSAFDQKDAYRDMYPARTQQFASEGRFAGLRPFSKDPRKIALIVVDMQWDFVHPAGALYVPGSQDDVARLVDFIYRNIEDITSVYASLDTHNVYQIFYDTWWKYADSEERPAPFTMISVNNRGEAVDMNGRRVLPVIDPVWSLGTYLPQLKSRAQKDLMIWPYHCMQGSMGHNLMPVLSEVFAFYAAARLSQVNFLVKGTCPQVEHYGIFAPEVPYPKDPNGGINTAVLDAIATHDLIYVAGEAKSHCVLETMKQLTRYFQSQPDVVRKIRFLVDCTSSVVHPTVDFETIAKSELAKMERQGVQLVNSQDPIK
ncbi:hypothetical protein HY469_01130 [Candidatus Roizmanbacteria bacterium]|nr:hypothetical protein [Candidatus Roizmanbacteria bacterium]